MRCLDLGCGGGEVTFEIARLVGQEGSVIDVDMDEVKLELARVAAVERGHANVEFRLADVNEWHETATYDLVYCRFLLQHLSRPVDLLRRMWAAVRPARSSRRMRISTASSASRRTTVFAFYARSYPRVLERHGRDAASGRKLYGSFLEAGIPHPSLRLVQRVDADGKAKTLSLSTLEATAEAIVSEKLASLEHVNAAIASLTAFTSDPTTLVGDPRVFQLWASRPA